MLLEEHTNPINQALYEMLHRLAEKEALLTLKGDKPNFYDNPNVVKIISPNLRLESLAKSCSTGSILPFDPQPASCSGEISQQSSRGSKKSLAKTNVNFFKFDIRDFYPSITEDLLTKSLEFTQNYIEVDEHTANIIMHCHQSILFPNGSV